nr:hypothetical protein [Burkholderia gladioli]
MIQSHPIARLLALALLLALPVLPATQAMAAAQQAVSTPVPAQGRRGTARSCRAARSAAPSAATTGSDLAQQAQSRLASSLATNSALANGQSITKAQAQADGLPFIARNFEQIDTAHSGRVSMQQVRQYLQQQQ